jgi:hypothetical protein
MLKKILVIALASLSILSFASVAFAAPGDIDATNPPEGFRLTGNNGLNSPDDIFGEKGIVNRITDWIFAILMTAAVVFILLAAFKYLTSKGGEEVTTAHKMLIWAMVAIAVGILAKGFVNVVRILIVN